MQAWHLWSLGLALAFALAPALAGAEPAPAAPSAPSPASSAASAAAPPASATPAAPAGKGGTEAVLRGLDKITARVSTIDAPVGKTVHFGALSITVMACHKAPPILPPNIAAFLEIDDQKPGEPTKRVFTGWMFASSPALSALQNPVYDVWVVDCLGDPAAAASAPPPAPSGDGASAASTAAGGQSGAAR